MKSKIKIKKRSSLKFGPIFGPKLGEEQQKKGLHSNAVLFFAQSQDETHNTCPLCHQTSCPTWKGGAHASIFLTFLCNFTILTTQRGGPWPPPKYAPAWEEHARHVVQKLFTARGILSKLRHHAPQSTLLNVYHSIVYPPLYYGVTSWSTAAAKCTYRIQIEQNYIVKVITKLPFVKTKIAPLYDQLDLLRLIDIYKLEVLKFMFSLKKNSLKMF